MKKIYSLTLFLTLLLLYSCKTNSNSTREGLLVENNYSKKFEIFKTEDGYLINVFNNFNQSDNIVFSYNLSNADNNKIKIPIKKVICLSTTHCAFISQLNNEQTIKGVSGLDYIYNKNLRKLIDEGKIFEVGHDQQINYERIIAINPDVVFVFGIDNNSISSYSKLEEIGVPIVYVADFLEEHPLGRTEWIKFFGCFYDKFDYSAKYFDSIANKYNSIIKNTNIEKSKPEVLVGLPWKGTWWLPGGNSFFANFIKDAGGNYMFGNNSSSESIPHTIEEIFSEAAKAEIWLNPSSVKTKNDITQIDDRLKNFPPINNARIFNNNKRTNEWGGNDFWESGILHPDVILNELNFIFYENKSLDSLAYYYSEIK